MTKVPSGSSGNKPGKAPESVEMKVRRPLGRRKRLGQLLVDYGFITEEQLWKILEQQKETGEPLGRCAISMGLINEEMLVQALAEQQGMKTIDLAEARIQPEAVALVDRSMCKLYKVMPVSVKDEVLTVALADPNNPQVLDDLRNFLDVREVNAVVASEAQVLLHIDRHYGKSGDSIDELVDGMKSEQDLTAKALRGDSIDLDSAEELADSAPVRKLLNLVITRAIQDKASDIHLEPFESFFRMRYRAEGVMVELTPPPAHLANAIASRVKVMANLDIAEHRIPQDGRIELTIGGQPVDLRVSVLPTMFGEGIVMRILDRSVVNLDLDKIGMPEKLLANFRELIQRPNGIVLVTGPTGSGKTTTLYSALSELNSIDIKIITTEDPIEYDIDGIVQVPINPDIEVTFAAALRSILRQDPDVILVGEIRDFETAQIAIQSSLTGHLVFSTLHTNDSPGAITRLRDMGVPAFLISATVEGVLAQRLVRRVCSKCREEYEPTLENLYELNLTPEKVQGRKFYRGRGCDYCNNTGLKGRTGLYELLVCSDDVRDLINRGATKDELMAAGRRSGMMTLRESGLKALFEGATVIEEVARETVLDEDIE